MDFLSSFTSSGRVSKLRQMFKARELFIHDGTAMRRIHVTARAQMIAASAAFFTLAVSAFGLAQAAIGASSMSNAISNFASRQAEVAAMEDRVEALQTEVSAIRTTAKQHAAKLEARQAFLAAMLKGEGDPAKLAAMVPSTVKAVDAEVAAAFSDVEQDQAAMAKIVRTATDARYRQTAQMISKLGFSPASLGAKIAKSDMTGVGGPYEPIPAGGLEKAVAASQPGQADPQFRALFNSWKRLDQLQTAIVAIPSMKPVQTLVFTSNFGVRTDPFRGGAAMHAGVDIPGAYATPIYATADATVNRAGWTGGYGNLVELNHGRGIQTRYGHLSSILVTPGMRVKRGQLIALMGSTGRSTGTHLHYEVRIDGRAVNPVPFLQTSDYLVAMQQRNGGTRVAVGGPIEKAGK